MHLISRAERCLKQFILFLLVSRRSSLTGIQNQYAWHVREKHLISHPAHVILSLKGISGNKAHLIREKYLDKAPKLIAKSLKWVFFIVKRTKRS